MKSCLEMFSLAHQRICAHLYCLTSDSWVYVVVLRLIKGKTPHFPSHITSYDWASLFSLTAKEIFNFFSNLKQANSCDWTKSKTLWIQQLCQEINKNIKIWGDCRISALIRVGFFFLALSIHLVSLKCHSGNINIY